MINIQNIGRAFKTQQQQKSNDPIQYGRKT